MGSNQNLKAYVRYDGSNRVVAGSLIFRRKKPKVGKWHEIAISECCEYIPTSTTTTSSTSTTTSTSTSTTSTTTTIASYYFLAYPGNSSSDACNHVNNGISVFANTTILGTLINLYMDPALTVPYNPNANGQYLSIYFNAADQVCTMSGNMINSYTSCG
jgi:hypothetical protein